MEAVVFVLLDVFILLGSVKRIVAPNSVLVELGKDMEETQHIERALRRGRLGKVALEQRLNLRLVKRQLL